MSNNRWLELVIDNTCDVYERAQEIASSASSEYTAGDALKEYLETQLDLFTGAIERARFATIPMSRAITGKVLLRPLQGQDADWHVHLRVLLTTMINQAMDTVDWAALGKRYRDKAAEHAAWEREHGGK